MTVSMRNSPFLPTMKGRQCQQESAAPLASSYRSTRRRIRRPPSSGKRSRTNAKPAKTRPGLKSASSTGRETMDARSPIPTKRSDVFVNRSNPLTFDFHRIGRIAHDVDLHCAYLDMDRRAIPRLRPLWAVCRIVGLRPMWIETRRTRHGWHVRIKLHDRLEPAELVAFQACCGSDSRREALNLMRVLAIRRNQITDPFWLKRWNLLYADKLAP